MKKILFLLFFGGSFLLNAQTLESTAKEKIKVLEATIKRAEQKHIDVQKEKMTIRTATTFLEFANWDAKHIEENTKAFKLVNTYKKEAGTLAKNLADFERSEVVIMLEEATTALQSIIDGKVIRKPSPKVDWSKVRLQQDALVFNNRPVFLADYTWKPTKGSLQEYFGALDGFFLTPSYVTDDTGTINPKKLQELQRKPQGTIGFIFLNHKVAPDWAEKKYGPGFKMRETTYTGYDIDNRGARFIQENLIKAMVPKMAGKNYSQLGYMLCNEPHFFTTAGAWATGPVSEYSMEKFRAWLTNKHHSLSELNALWKTDFKTFDKVTLEIPISEQLLGTPQWYDWVTFNNYRVTKWFNFLKDEIVKYDPQAKVHLKIMPHLWSDNKRNHGLDVAALTDMSGIIGNDAAASYSTAWGEPDDLWQDYSFSWRELCMSYDFFKSISPDKIIFNSEGHFLSTVRFRDLYMKPDYARTVYWLAHTLGLNASQTWYWPRKEDGSMKKENDKGYAGSVIQQPRIVNEVTTTMMDLNTFSEEITALQRQKKPIRIFYSETSAVNTSNYMDEVFEVYKSLYFDGIPIGFATKDIICKQDNNLWDVIIVHKTPYVTDAEFKILQTYLDNGGTVIVDSESLKMNEYKQIRKEVLQVSKGKLIWSTSVPNSTQKAFEIVNEKKHTSQFNLVENNALNTKGCIWKTAVMPDGRSIISIVNIGKGTAEVTLTFGDEKTNVFTNLITGETVYKSFKMNSKTVLLLEAKQ
ncbi:beta-galactosidase [Flavobacterium fluviatile]|uniref:beta-galactosidase n=1 Tax=Flavobacterium fluviatile TaxID=1862387 RepID=UPI0013D148A3|nr:beta-galactosidase [Flavobacterium fluviatile]